MFTPLENLCQYSGTAICLIGAILIATKSKYSREAFMFFLVGNLLWVAFAISTKAWGLLTLESAFSVINLIGIYQWRNKNENE